MLTAGRDRSTEKERRGVWLGVWAVYVKITYQKLTFLFRGKNVNMYFTFIQAIFKTISNMNTSISVYIFILITNSGEPVRDLCSSCKVKGCERRSAKGGSHTMLIDSLSDILLCNIHMNSLLEVIL